MSNNVNQDLMDRAWEQIEVWTGTMHANLIESALKSNDLETLRYYVANAEADQARMEFHANDAL